MTKKSQYSISDKVRKGIEIFRKEAHHADDQPLDPATALPNAHIKLIFGSRSDAACPNQHPDAVIVDEALKDDPQAIKQAVVHRMAHSIIKREGIDRDVRAHMRHWLARATEEIIAEHVEAEMCVPSKALLHYLRAHPEADNFDAAMHFGVPHQLMTRRIIEVLASPFTNDREFPHRVLQEILRRCLSRVLVVGRWQISDYLAKDPPIVSSQLVYTETLKTLKAITQAASNPGEAAGHTILVLLKAHSSPDIQIFVEHLPLRITEDVIFSLAALPPSHAAVAVATFYSKLGQFEAVRRVTGNLKILDKPARAEILALLARIELRTDKVNGAAKAEEMCRQALAIDRKCVEAIIGRASALIAQERYPEALRVLEPLGDVPAANYFRGRAYDAADVPDEALRYYERVTLLEHHPFWRKGKQREAMIHVRLNNHLLAITHFAEALERHPYDAGVLRAYLPFLLQIGNFDEAVQRLLTLAHVAPLQPWTFRMLGNAFNIDGRTDFAVPLWLEAQLLEETLMNRIAA